MTEFEAATIAFQQATLALQQGQLWAAIAIPAVSGLVGLGQCWLIWLGIRRMSQASDQRAAREDARHAEVMQALDGQRQALDSQRQGMDSQRQALEVLIKGMETVIERTGGRA